jgi:hypothetical protein
MGPDGDRPVSECDRASREPSGVLPSKPAFDLLRRFPQVQRIDHPMHGDECLGLFRGTVDVLGQIEHSDAEELKRLQDSDRIGDVTSDTRRIIDE